MRLEGGGESEELRAVTGKEGQSSIVSVEEKTLANTVAKVEEDEEDIDDDYCLDCVAEMGPGTANRRKLPRHVSKEELQLHEHIPRSKLIHGLWRGHRALHRATLASQGKPSPPMQSVDNEGEETMCKRCTHNESVAAQAWTVLQLGACHACPDVLTLKEDLVACSQCNLKYCVSRCVPQYGDTPEAIKENPKWICYFCQGLCTCTQCKRMFKRRAQTHDGDWYGSRTSKQLAKRVQRLEERVSEQDKVVQVQQETIKVLLAKAQEHTDFQQRMEEFMASNGFKNISRKRAYPSEE